MADEPTPRAQWNVRVFFALLVFLFAAGLTVWGLVSNALEWKEAALPWIGAGLIKANDLLAGK